MASWVGLRSTTTPSQVDAVARAIRSTPLVDNHGHPLLKLEALGKHPLLSITTEASGDAALAATTSLPHLRAVRQLARVLQCGLTWESVVAAIEQRHISSFEDWTAQCLAGIETILVDDGLDTSDDAENYAWHDDYTRSKCKRIVRIEKVAADIISRLGKACDASTQTRPDVFDDAFDEWLGEFDASIKAALEDPDVVGFKSVICYRTGLGVLAAPDEDAARKAFGEILANFSLLDFERLQEVSLNDLVVHRTATLIRDCGLRHKKPIQFHTGLGDNDITLSKSSPSHLQAFIRAYPTVPIVLLHASYPFTREAGYLASVYENVYADIGEVFPVVSQDGQERVLRQILELCPWSKILWSSDGHWFPETYLLANMQMREVLETVWQPSIFPSIAETLALLTLDKGAVRFCTQGPHWMEGRHRACARCTVQKLEQALPPRPRVHRTGGRFRGRAGPVCDGPRAFPELPKKPGNARLHPHLLGRLHRTAQDAHGAIPQVHDAAERREIGRHRHHQGGFLLAPERLDDAWRYRLGRVPPTSRLLFAQEGSD